MSLSEEITALLDGLGLSAWGTADLTLLAGCAPPRFTRGLVMVAGHYPGGENPGVEGYEESAHHAAETEAARLLDDAAGRLAELLDARGIEHFRVQGQDEETLSSCFAHKTAATLAGLGWVGKNDLLVTRAAGPLLETAVVLCAEGPSAGEPVTRSMCGSCSACVEACPAGALRGGTWEPGTGRDTLIDAFACDRYRRSFIGELGRKHACGLCAVACPVTRGRAPSS